MHVKTYINISIISLLRLSIQVLFIYVLFIYVSIYSFWLGSKTTAVSFDPRTDLLTKAAWWGQQIRSRNKQNCFCPRSQSIIVLLYTYIFSKISYSLFLSTYLLVVFNILVHKFWEYGRSFDIVTLISRDLLNQWK